VPTLVSIAHPELLGCDACTPVDEDVGRRKEPPERGEALGFVTIDRDGTLVLVDLHVGTDCDAA
jgi:hypothetical protein